MHFWELIPWSIFLTKNLLMESKVWVNSGFTTCANIVFLFDNESSRNAFEFFLRFYFPIVVARHSSVRSSRLGPPTFRKFDERILLKIRSCGQLRETSLLERILSAFWRLGLDQSTFRSRKCFLHRQGRVWAFLFQGKQNQTKIQTVLVN